MNNAAPGEILNDDIAPLPVRFPLSGEWFAANTPGHKIPSHGTNQLGQRYAYDFVSRQDMAFARKFMTGVRYWFAGGIPLCETNSWKAPILSPVSGTIIDAKDNWPERLKATPMDIFRVLTAGFRLSEEKLRKDYRTIAGNYLIIEGKDCFAFIAHITPGSIRVKEGDEVKAGQHIGNVGHTGNSTMPHLHFHLMDGPDLWTANGLPCCFTLYEQLKDNDWQQIENGIPGNKYLIRTTTL